ncbi:MAG: nitroreductase family protein [Oscillospiraceae bacterium]|nr:nitroreductase family protein [Oscillospiraceae bacterium]
MNFTELAKTRYSVRSFDPRPIEEEKLKTILEAGHLAPTAKNNQPQRIYVIRSEEGLAKIRSLTKCHFGAPVVLLFAYNADEEWNNPLEAGVRSGQEDVSIVATHIMLQATELGVGSIWVNLFAPTETKRALGLPENETPVLLMPLGYAAPDAQPGPNHTKYRPLAETVIEL